MLRCWCWRCKNRAVTGIARSERLRGFELEFDNTHVGVVGTPKGCKEHLEYCPGKICTVRVPLATELMGIPPCTCPRCSVLAKTPAAKAPPCEGHSPCIKPGFIGGARVWFAGVVKKAANGIGHVTAGDFGDWHKTRRDTEAWDLKTDRSCGYEIATPPMNGEEMERLLGGVLDKIAEAEKAHGTPFHSAKCGLHCTVDVQDLPQRKIRNLFLFTLRHQAALIGTQPPQRAAATKEYCKYYARGKSVRRSMAARDDWQNWPDQTPNGEVRDKNHLVNFTKVVKDRLVEFRFGGMSTDVKEVAAMGTLVECFVEASLKPTYDLDPKHGKKERFFNEVIRPFMDDPRVVDMWTIIKPRLDAADLARV